MDRSPHSLQKFGAAPESRRRRFGARHIWRLPSLYRYPAAVASVAATVGIRYALNPLLGSHAPYLPFALMLMLVGLVCGRGPALLATALSAACVDWMFIRPIQSLAIADPGALAGLILFAVVGALISLTHGRLRDAFLAVARSEAVLREQAEMIDLSHDAIITADPNRVITGWNGGAVELYGWSENEAVGKVTHQFLRTEGAVSTREIDAILARDGRWDGELIHTTADGRQIVTESRHVLVRGRNGVPTGILEINRDITDRRTAREQLERAHRRMIAIVEAIADGFCVLDTEWRYSYVNQAAAKMFGKELDQLLGRNLWEVWPDLADSPFGEAYRRAVRENVPVEVEAFRPAMNAWLDVRCYPSPEGLTVFLRDTTQRKRERERLGEVQKMESVGMLAGGVAHDFNNLLTVIMGNASSALDECPSCEYAQAIVTASERAADLTRQLLAYAGKGRSVVQQVDLTDLVRQSRPLLAASLPSRAALNLDLAEGLPRVTADPNQLQQALVNLMINSAEAIAARDGGHVDVATGSCEIAAEAVQVLSPRYDVVAGVYVWLEVRDNGMGMDEAILLRVFDPFFSTKFIGRGLGLAAVDGIARSSRGFVEVSSTPGAGSTFRMLLPATE